MCAKTIFIDDPADWPDDNNDNKDDIRAMFRRNLFLDILNIGEQENQQSHVTIKWWSRILIATAIILWAIIILFVASMIPARCIVGQEEVLRVFPEMRTMK